MIESDASAGGAPPTGVDPLLGRVLNERFKILEALGSGGMGRVYKAVQSPLDRLVALKVLNPQYGQDKDPGFQRRFFLEAAVTAKLRHPNTVTVIDQTTGDVLSHHTIDPDRSYWRNQHTNPGRWPTTPNDEPTQI